MLVKTVKLCLILGIYAVYLTLKGLYLIGSPYAVLVLHFKAERLACARTAEKVIRFDKDGYIVKHVGMELGSAQQSGLAACFVQRFISKFEIFYAKRILADFQAFFHSFDSFGHKYHLVLRDYPPI